MKSHLPFDALPYDPDVRYVYVGRDTRDTFMSLYNHYSGYTDLMYGILDSSDPSGRPMPRCPESPRELWAEWITRGFLRLGRRRLAVLVASSPWGVVLGAPRAPQRPHGPLRRSARRPRGPNAPRRRLRRDRSRRGRVARACRRSAIRCDEEGSFSERSHDAHDLAGRRRAILLHARWSGWGPSCRGCRA